MRVLLIDNFDSFTYNLADLLFQAFGQEVTVVTNTADWNSLEIAQFDLAVISPGPGSPAVPTDVGISAKLLCQAQLPVLGVCLGHQLIAHCFGGTVEPADFPLHGQVSEVVHDKTGLFAGLPNPLRAVRYHSLAVTSLPECLTVTARAADGTVMALRHRSLPFAGVQFHPESIASAAGIELLRNFAAEYCRAQRIHWQEVPYPITAESLFDGLFGEEANAIWLDSSLPDAQYGRYSVMTAGPQVHATELSQLQFELDAMQVMDAEQVPFPFRPGLIGALDYELDHPIMLRCNRAVVLDHVSSRAYVVAIGDVSEWACHVSSTIAGLQPLPEPNFDSGIEFQFDLPRSAYLAAIDQAQCRILDGDSYEICLTTTARGRALADPWQTYRRLRRVSPVPFGAFLRTPEVSVLCASPERFLSVEANGLVQARPIKGTRPRGFTIAEDAELIVGLAQSVKDRSENLMIVDLLRNDLAQVCLPGSVRVPELFEVETFAQVHQLVSTISGRLRPEASAVDAIAAAFPGGSMTGAPKTRTMQIIAELEPKPRGYYSGAIGWLGCTGSADFNIVIRTLVSTRAETTFGVGGAIVHLSDPAAEFEEILVKARAMLAAVNGTLLA